jgi:hypothetical protein
MCPVICLLLNCVLGLSALDSIMQVRVVYALGYNYCTMPSDVLACESCSETGSCTWPLENHCLILYS